MTIQLEQAEIPRRKTSFGGEGGPLVIPPGAKVTKGKKKCETCGRSVATDRAFPRKGACKCLYYKRTTTFIDVLQDEYLLKQWGNRNVAYGMSQRPDLVLQASSCSPDKFANFDDESKRELNIIAAEAQREAGDKIKATIGTSLHRLTHRMDRGDTLGVVPERWQGDLKAYDAEIKRLGIQWVSVESFRVLDDWVKPITECNHKPIRYGGSCLCMGVAGTVDRIGWYKGRLRIFDIKTGSQFNKLGHAMQLAMYAHMVPYQFPGDARVSDAGDIDFDVAHIIYLPEGKGECSLEAMDIGMGWRASVLAKNIWEARDWNPVIERDWAGELTEMASRAGTLAECRMLWNNAKKMGRLDVTAKAVLQQRVSELKAKGVVA